MDAHSIGQFQPARDPLHGRDLRLLSARSEPALEDADAHAAQAGSCIRTRLRAGNAKSGRSRLQGPGQLRHLVHRSPANGAGQDAGDRGTRQRTRRCERHGSRHTRPAALNARTPRVSDAQRPRRRTLPDAESVGLVVPARATDGQRNHPRDGCAAAHDRDCTHARRRSAQQHEPTPAARRHPRIFYGRHRRRQQCRSPHAIPAADSRQSTTALCR